jgi:RHS repeat-associated protein
VGDDFAVLRVDRSGNVTHFAGDSNLDPYSCLTGTCPAATSGVDPTALAVGQDGSVYIAQENSNWSIVQKIDPSGNISILAGTPGATGTTDASPARNGLLNQPDSIAVAPDGTVYIADLSNSRLRRIGTDGALTTVAGAAACCATQTCGGDGDGGQASAACLPSPSAVGVGSDGAVYVSQEDYQSQRCRVRRIDPSGTINTFAGSGVCAQGATYGDGLPATQASVGIITGISVGPDGSVYMTDQNNSVMWMVDTAGVMHKVVGISTQGPLNDGAPSVNGSMYHPLGVMVGPDGSVYTADSQINRVRSVSPSFPGYSPLGITLPSESGDELYIFDVHGRHQQTLDPVRGSVRAQFNYDPTSHQLTSIVDGSSNTTTIGRTASTVTITAPFGQTTTMNLDGNGYAQSIVNPHSETYSFTYQNGLMQTLIDPNGQPSTKHVFTFDGVGNLLSDTDATGATKTLALTTIPTGRTVNVTSGAGVSTLHTVTNAVSTGGLPTTDRRIVQMPSGATATYDRTIGEVRTLTAADGTVTTSSMMPDPRFGMLDPYVGTYTQSIPAPLSLTYTAQRTRTATQGGNPLSWNTPATLVEQVRLNLQTFNNNPAYFTTSYSQATGLTTYSTPYGRQVAETIDAKGRVVTISYPGTQLASTNITYNDLGSGEGNHGRVALVQMTPPTGSSDLPRTWTPKYDYTPNDTGFMSSMIDPLNRTYSYSRDPVGRVTVEQLPDWSPTQTQNEIMVSYDSNGNVGSTTPPAQPAHNFDYTTVNLLKDYYPPDTTPTLGDKNTQYTYNADRQPLTVVSPYTSTSFQQLAYQYDPGGRTWTLSDQLGTTKEYTYRGSGSNPPPITDQLLSVATNDGVTLSYQFDGFLVTQATWAVNGATVGSIGRTYDNFFRVLTRTVGSTAVTYNYDPDGLYQGTQTPSFVVSRDYQGPNGLVTGTTLGSVSDAWTYNSFSELLSYSATSGSITLYSMTGQPSGPSITRDQGGRITAMLEHIGGTTGLPGGTPHSWGFGYDTRGRLQTATRDGTTTTYGYDANGNRTTINNVLVGVYDTQDRLTQNPLLSIAYQYTNNGDLSQKTVGGTAVTNYGYDLEGNLRSVSLPGGIAVAYTIDGKNRRIGRKLTQGSSSLQQWFLYDDQLRIAAELDGSYNVVSVFVYGTKPNVPDYMVRGGTAYRIISDQLGSVRIVANSSSGAIVQQVDYDEFGNVLDNSDPCATNPLCAMIQPFGFAGGVYDKDTGMVRFGARDFDPQSGRWMAKDQMRFDGGDTNLSSYAADDPINARDLNGKNIDGFIQCILFEVSNGVPVDVAVKSCRSSFPIGGGGGLGNWGGGGSWGGAGGGGGDGDGICEDPRHKRQRCIDICRGFPGTAPGGSFLGNDLHRYVNDIGGAWAFHRCIDECMGYL